MRFQTYRMYSETIQFVKEYLWYINFLIFGQNSIFCGRKDGDDTRTVNEINQTTSAIKCNQ